MGKKEGGREMGKLKKEIQERGKGKEGKVGQGAVSSLHKEPHCETPRTLSSLPASVSSSLTYSLHLSLQLTACFF